MHVQVLAIFGDYSQALKVLREAVHRRPHDADACLSLARALLGSIRRQALVSIAEQAGVGVRKSGPREASVSSQGGGLVDGAPQAAKSVTSSPFDPSPDIIEAVEREEIRKEAGEDSRAGQAREAEEAMELVEGVVKREVRHVRGMVSLAIVHENTGALSVAQRCFGFALLEAPRDYEALIGMLYVAGWPGVCLSVWVVGGWELMLRCLYRDRVCGWFTECACRDGEDSDSATRQEGRRRRLLHPDKRACTRVSHKSCRHLACRPPGVPTQGPAPTFYQ